MLVYQRVIAIEWGKSFPDKANSVAGSSTFPVAPRLALGATIAKMV